MVLIREEQTPQIAPKCRSWRSRKRGRRRVSRPRLLQPKLPGGRREAGSVEVPRACAPARGRKKGKKKKKKKEPREGECVQEKKTSTRYPSSNDVLASAPTWSALNMQRGWRASVCSVRGVQAVCAAYAACAVRVVCGQCARRAQHAQCARRAGSVCGVRSARNVRGVRAVCAVCAACAMCAACGKGPSQMACARWRPLLGQAFSASYPR